MDGVEEDKVADEGFAEVGGAGLIWEVEGLGDLSFLPLAEGCAGLDEVGAGSLVRLRDRSWRRESALTLGTRVEASGTGESRARRRRRRLKRTTHDSLLERLHESETERVEAWPGSLDSWRGTTRGMTGRGEGSS